MHHGERDEFGRLNVSDDELRSAAIGALITVSLSVEAVMKLLECDQWEAEAFIEGASADLARIRMLIDREAADDAQRSPHH